MAALAAVGTAVHTTYGNKVGSFFCLVLRAVGEESEGFCCPAPSEAAGIPFCCPVGSDRAFVFVT